MIIAFCGLSGTGKSTIAREISKLLKFPFVITYTTRPIRPGEKDGVDYHFINDAAWNELNSKEIIVAPQSFEVASGDVWNYGIDKTELNQNTVMVLTPSGVNDLRAIGYDVVSFYIDINEDIRLERIYGRNDNQGREEIKRRSIADRQIFKQFKPDYIINNNGTLRETLDQFFNIIQYKYKH